MNGLLATAGGALLCLHDHNFGHLLAGQHSDEGDSCHRDEAESDYKDLRQEDSDDALFAVSDQHCIDIVVSSSDEPIQRVADLLSIKKPVAESYYYQLFAPIIRANAVPQIRIATRAPPFFCSTLEQCVRKTVLRI